MRQSAGVMLLAPMRHQRGLVFICVICLAVGGLLALAGCGPDQPSREKVELPPKYPTLPPKQNLPAFMKGTIYEFSDMQNKEPYPVSGYGLVVGLANTGDNMRLPLVVKDFMVDEMVRHGFGSQDERLRHLKPEAMLADPRVAVVETYGLLPAGVRAGQRVDVLVRVPEGSQTRSLRRGNLYETSQYVNGVDPVHPKGRVNIYIKAHGPVFVNPGPVLSGSNQPASLASQRVGTVMNGGLVLHDRPLFVRIRNPQRSIAQGIEATVDQYFSDESVAKAQDEGMVYLYVPRSFNGDWQHFVGVVTHLYLGASPAFAPIKARMLVEEAQKPDALLADISYCWEGLGPDVLPFIRPLYVHNAPDVAFAAMRAGAFLRDATAEEALLEVARMEGNPFQLNAVKTLGAMSPSMHIERMLAGLLSAKNALVRIEAYRVLAERGSPAVISRVVRNSFVLDRVPCGGEPLVYAMRTGTPRIAVIGPDVNVATPLMFRAMDDKLTISSAAEGQSVVVFDRTGEKEGGVSARIRPDLYEMLYRLGGGSDDGFSFVYSDIVAVLQGLSDGRKMPAAFVLQDLPALQDAIEGAPPIVEPDGSPQPDAGDPGVRLPFSARKPGAPK
jgi:hypothetical protein